MAEFQGPSFEQWAAAVNQDPKRKKVDTSWLDRATKVAKGGVAPVVEEPAEEERTVAAADAAPASAPEPDAIEPEDIPLPEPEKPKYGDTLNKDLMWQAVIAAAPALIGAVAGGNMGGAAGAQAGVGALQELRKERLDQEKEQAAQDFKREALDVNKAKVKVAAMAAGQKLTRQQQQDELQRQRFEETKRHNNATESIIGQRFDVTNAKDLQNGYMKDPDVVKSQEALKSIKEAKGLIASGNASDATKVQLKLAAIYNQGRPSDQDFKAVAGSQAYWDKLARWADKGFSNKATAKDI
ncbi:MAG TPA: hypothetical protein VHL10_01785, partial [Nitrososphaera sp.]|nr:hypothetical protein [Nitrososphaera sp.]